MYIPYDWHSLPKWDLSHDMVLGPRMKVKREETEEKPSCHWTLEKSECLIGEMLQENRTSRRRLSRFEADFYM